MRAKILNITSAVTFLAVSAFAVDAKVDSNIPQNYPQGNKVLQASTGGMLWQPFTGAGRLTIIDLQHEVSKEVLEKVKDAIMEETHINIVFEADEAKRGELNIIVEETNGDRVLAIYPEQNEAKVNISPLKIGNPSPDKLASRIRKEILRAFAFIAGAASSPAEISLMDSLSKPVELDLRREKIPNEVEMRFTEYLPKIGVKPYRAVPYSLACEEGWAPQPANKRQQAIWDKTHAVPATPMKIEFDPKKGR